MQKVSQVLSEKIAQLFNSTYIDEKYLFHTDSAKKTIIRYNYDASTGSISNPELFYKGKDEDGTPDGITIDVEGNIWIACWGGSQVICLNREGEIKRKIGVPAIQVSSLIFGGENMDTLHITTAAYGCKNINSGLNENGAFLGGKVYFLKTDTAGRAEWPCNL